MILKKSSYKAMKYSCLVYHYAKRIPAQPMVGYSVFNKKNEWCGCIIYNNGIGNIILVSYADSDEGHSGTIYKATNWYYIGSHKTGDKYICKKTGKDIHSRSQSKSGYSKQFGVWKKVYKTSDLIKIKKGVKHKFIYPLNKKSRKLCELMAKNIK